MTELSGTFDGVGLPAIVRFLSGLNKTGCLRIVHHDWQGEIQFDAGKVIGATDKEGAFVTDRPVRPADVAYTVYQSLGIDPRRELRTPEGRPVQILGEGAAVEELYT